MTREELIAQLIAAEEEIRKLPDANYFDISAAQSARQAVVSLDTARQLVATIAQPQS